MAICREFIERKRCNDSRCTLVHSRKHYPCTWKYCFGRCKLGDSCNFSHAPIVGESDLKEFMTRNKKFLCATMKKDGSTPMGQDFLDFLDADIEGPRYNEYESGSKAGGRTRDRNNRDRGYNPLDSEREERSYNRESR